MVQKKQLLYKERVHVSGSTFTDQPSQTTDGYFCSVEDDRQCEVNINYLIFLMTENRQSSVLEYLFIVAIAFMSLYIYVHNQTGAIKRVCYRGGGLSTITPQ